VEPPSIGVEDFDLVSVAETFGVVWLKRATYERRPQPGAAWLFGM
jgi:hypothetical protein